MRSAVATSSFLQLLFIIVLVSTLRLFLQLYIYFFLFFFFHLISSAFCCIFSRFFSGCSKQKCNSFWSTPLKSMMIMTALTMMMMMMRLAVHILAFAFSNSHSPSIRVFFLSHTTVLCSKFYVYQFIRRRRSQP